MKSRLFLHYTFPALSLKCCECSLIQFPYVYKPLAMCPMIVSMDAGVCFQSLSQHLFFCTAQVFVTGMEACSWQPNYATSCYSFSMKQRVELGLYFPHQTVVALASTDNRVRFGSGRDKSQWCHPDSASCSHSLCPSISFKEHPTGKCAASQISQPPSAGS